MAGGATRHATRSARLLVWLRSALTLTVLTGLYFTVPMRSSELRGGPVGRVVLLIIGLVLLTALVVFQVARTLRGRRLVSEQIAMLLTVVDVVIVFFSFLYYRLADQFEGVQSRLDALYFSVVTLCTVGYGDVTPVGQTARAIVIVQMLFDLVIVTSALSIIISGARRLPSR